MRDAGPGRSSGWVFDTFHDHNSQSLQTTDGGRGIPLFLGGETNRIQARGGQKHNYKENGRRGKGGAAEGLQVEHEVTGLVREGGGSGKGEMLFFYEAVAVDPSKVAKREETGRRRPFLCYFALFPSKSDKILSSNPF